MVNSIQVVASLTTVTAPAGYCSSSLLVVSLNLSSYNHDNVLGSPRKPSMLMSFDLYDLHDIVGYQ